MSALNSVPNSTPLDRARLFKTAVVLLTLASIASCSLTDRFRRPSRLDAVPSGEVTSDPLEVTPTARPQDDDPEQPGDATNDPLVQTNQQPAEPVATANTRDVNRADLIGAWSMVSAGTSCQLILTLTTWAGGYRATTRGCGADSLGGIAAWSLDGKKIVLKGSDNATIAVLFGSTSQRYDGRTTGGNDISFSR